MKTKLLASSLLALAAVYSQAGIQYRYVYGLDLTTADPITNLIVFDHTTRGGSATWAFQVQGPGVQTFGNPFLFDSPATETSMIGLSTDVTGAEHLVITANASALGAIGTDFNNHFTGYDEATLINAVHEFTSGLPFGNPILQDGMDKVNSFEDAFSSELYTPVNFVGEAIEFSNGVNIGSFTVTNQAVPEPATMSIMAVGAVALMRRRKSAR